jgi:hypothetical protein
MRWLAPVVSLACVVPAQAATKNAASCSQANVQSAIASAAPGDTVQVPAGSCSWSGISITGIQLVGAGSSTAGTVITSGMVTLNKHSTQYTRLSGFRFAGGDQHVETGETPTGKPYIIDNNYFKMDVDGVALHLGANGGLLHHNQFTAESWTDGDVFSIQTVEDWSQAPTFGTADSAGERNIYFEDNTFTNVVETAPDGDVGARLVIRHNTYVDSSIVFHGGDPSDSSPNGGNRQFEIYNNTFSRVSNQLPLNKWVWVRGSTGVIANNVIPKANSPDGSTYPDKVQIRLSLACPNPYPMQYQVGQSNPTPEHPPSHPVLIFGNTGSGTTDSSFISVDSSDTAGGSCGDPLDYIKQGRDYMLSNTWGWTPYVYPHPLSGGGPHRPAAPSSPRIIR